MTIDQLSTVVSDLQTIQFENSQTKNRIYNNIIVVNNTSGNVAVTSICLCCEAKGPDP